MAHLILVRHSQPEIIPNVDPTRWQLSDEGRKRCLALAEDIRVYQPTRFITSMEAKAAETGKIIAEKLGVPYESAENLHEQVRDNEPFEDQAVFQKRIAGLFERPDELIYGRETGHEAYARFAKAIDGLIGRYQEQTIGVISHGTVISLFIAHHNPIDAVTLWKRLKLPDFFICSIPDFRLIAPDGHLGG